MDTPANIARLAHVDFIYQGRGGTVAALKDVSLDVHQGEFCALVGANGSGKSTLARVLAGLAAPDAGEIELVGKATYSTGKPDFAAYRQARRNLGYVFQSPADQIVTSIVEEDVAFGPENLQIAPSEIAQRVERELERVAMQHFAQANPSELSGGQSQRINLASALAMEPQMLVLDEPATLLDVRGREALIRQLMRLRDAGMTIVLVTHNMEAARQADRVAVLSAGRLLAVGSPAEVFAQQALVAQARLTQPFAGQLSSALKARGWPIAWTLDEEKLTSAIARHLSAVQSHDRAAQQSGVRTKVTKSSDAAPIAVDVAHPVITVSHVSFSYRTLTTSKHRRCSSGQTPSAQPALDDISFEVESGSRMAIVGQTGSGKSTLLRLIAGLDAPDAGTITLASGQPATPGAVGYVMQMPERQLFAETLRADAAYGPSNQGLDAAEINERVDEALELSGLADKAAASPFELSGGQRRLAAIAGIIAMRPAILLLDEPTAGLDPEARERLHTTLDELHRRGTTLIQVTHAMEDAAQMDRIVFIDQGHLVALATPEAFFTHATELEEAGLGLPEALRWAQRLEKAGAELGTPLTLSALVDAICAASTPGGGSWR